MEIQQIVKKALPIVLTALTSVTFVFAENVVMGQKAPQKNNLYKSSPKELVDEVWQIIHRSYIDGTFNGQDWQAIRKSYLNRSYSSHQDAYKAINEMLGKLGDRFTRLIVPEEFKAMQINSETAAIGLNVRAAGSEIVVYNPIENTPAYKAGILAGDVLIKIDGKTTQGMNLINVASRLRGAAGTTVNLTVRRGQKQLEFKIVREIIKLQSVSYRVEKTPQHDIGYIRLTQFSTDTATQIRKAIQDLEAKKVSGYILDMRSNSGGLLYSTVEIARMWINKGTIVSTVQRVGEVEREEANGKALTDKPLVVIINESTASGAEILTAALQENDRAILVGSKTIGYNTIQSVRPLDDGSGIAVTIAKWRTPKGKDINNIGISPNVVVNLTSFQQQEMFEKRSFGTIADPQFSSSVNTLTQIIQKKYRGNSKGAKSDN
jgi:carboxyl-terminal processing protease